MKMLKLILIAAICMMVPAGAFGVELLYNGDFEEVNIDGALELLNWSHSYNVEGSGGAWGQLPPGDESNQYMAAMDWVDRYYDAWLYQIVDTTGYGSATISFDYSFFTWAWNEEESGDDTLAFAVGVGSTIVNLLTFPISGGVGTDDTTEWATYSLTIDNLGGGYWFVGFGLFNTGNDIFGYQLPGNPARESVVYLDNVSFDATPIPEPGSLALLGSGLAGLCFMARSRRAKHGKTPAAL